MRILGAALALSLALPALALAQAPPTNDPPPLRPKAKELNNNPARCLPSRATVGQGSDRRREEAEGQAAERKAREVERRHLPAAPCRSRHGETGAAARHDAGDPAAGLAGRKPQRAAQVTRQGSESAIGVPGAQAVCAGHPGANGKRCRSAVCSRSPGPWVGCRAGQARGLCLTGRAAAPYIRPIPARGRNRWRGSSAG